MIGLEGATGAPDRFRQMKHAALGIRAFWAGGGAGGANRLKRLGNLGRALYWNWCQVTSVSDTVSDTNQVLHPHLGPAVHLQPPAAAARAGFAPGADGTRVSLTVFRPDAGT